MNNSSCQPNHTDPFSAANRNRCEKYVRAMQRRLDNAVANGDKAKTRFYFHLLSKRSKAVKVLSVYKVTAENDGKYTAGIDGIALPKTRDRQENDRFREKLINEIDITEKPAPIRRVLIPKPNGKKRPLGIPTIKDRIVQDIIRTAIEPIVEYHFNAQSYGFRPKRSCHDAIADLFYKLCRKGSRDWIVEGDIKGCFDHICHKHILNQLQKWDVPQNGVEIVKRMLKAKVLVERQFVPTDAGTPQGGILSPLLANVALTALDDFCNSEFSTIHKRVKSGAAAGKRYKTTLNPIVRYADDFVILCESKEKAEEIKRRVSEYLNETIGLQLSAEKTKITHINHGFDFLGFNIRKYTPKKKKHFSPTKGKCVKVENQSTSGKTSHLLIKPQKEKVTKFLRDCKQVIKQNKNATTQTLLMKLNPKLRGWGFYYRYVVSKTAFNAVDHHLWDKTFRWAKRRHPKKTASWVINKYYSKRKIQKFGKVFDRKILWDTDSNDFLYQTSWIPIRRYIRLNKQYRVYDRSQEAIEYWQKREYQNALIQIDGVKMDKLFRRQKGKCAYCNAPIPPEMIAHRQTHKHHLNPYGIKYGGKQLSNLRLLHKNCHQELHAMFTLKEMSDFVTHGIDYLRLLKKKPVEPTD